jgi:hypothetical protein
MGWRFEGNRFFIKGSGSKRQFGTMAKPFHAGNIESWLAAVLVSWGKHEGENGIIGDQAAEGKRWHGVKKVAPPNLCLPIRLGFRASRNNGNFLNLILDHHSSPVTERGFPGDF